MDRDRRYFFLGGIAAFGFYFLLILLLLLFFNDYKKSKRYVPKPSQSIEVSVLQTPLSRPKTKSFAKRSQKQQQKQKMPAVRKKSSASLKTSKPSRPKAIASLFKNVKVKAPSDTSPAARLANAPKIKYKASSDKRETERPRAEQLVRDINLSKPTINISSKSSGQGEVDAYMSKLYEMLYASWHPEAVFAGSHATVRLDIAPDGSFAYRIVYPSDNQAFNHSLIEYLEQIKAKRFPPHKRKRNLVIDVEFKAKE
ncbi:TonB C-terminal domain-containing protein [Hydrogenimonas cancrithermarum]|uniref:TonB C-terminal domain-containing protein n=1 Tax=Hydrogenimonas cancrithermarum TaxID=2993563 RepID=A0ABM8FJ73_9BACT|nr:TonB C-terminal domain-containing protein [Hydrogenimonas cancrithermarum]BDY12336.1 hypothetical protein HCR_06480 [Hydrogenimonas cancrithermarum]